MSPPSLSRCRMLIVEDDALVRDTISLMLEDDYEIDAAASVSAALALMRQPGRPAPEVILLDCLLPDGDLADVLAEADRQTIPVVLISGDPRQAERIDPKRRFLAKPFTRQSLLSILDTARR